MSEKLRKRIVLVGSLIVLLLVGTNDVFAQPSVTIGTVITNPDGSKGVVFYINPSYTGGCMVALEDVATDCPWGSENDDVPYLRNYTYSRNECQLSDMDGYANTVVLREYQSANPNYAPGKVDFAHGWYVPSAGQLRKIYSALPFIENAITDAGGTTLSTNAYWSSTEKSATDAWSPAFELCSYPKTSNRSLRAVRDFSINNTLRVQVASNNTDLGTVAGSGFYSVGSQVTVTATPAGDNLFRGWTEAGHLVSQDLTYTFPAYSNRELVANFAIRGGVGTLVTNPDGSQGILFHLNEDGTEGWMVALEDASDGCQWGPANDIVVLRDRPLNDQKILEDLSGYHNTQLIRISQGTDNSYAASLVDFDNGWYLPSSGQLRKLFAALPLIEEAILKAGGSLTSGTYWSSTEHSSSYVLTPGFEAYTTSKTSYCKVRAIRNYYPAGDNVVLVAANDDGFGTVSVSGSGMFAQDQVVTVTATPNVGYQFDHWTEDGAIVSYDAEYQFPFTRSRSLVAHFVVPNSVGSIVTNADGSRGVVFYSNPLESVCLMVALEDDSEGCVLGASDEDIALLENQNPSQTQNLLTDLSGYDNTGIIREWQSNNPNYAAGKVDYSDGWFLPSVGQMRKLYAALPLIEESIVCAGGSLMTGDSYWSSSENSNTQAWSPSFEFTKTFKTTNCRVRAIRSVFPIRSITATANPTFAGTVEGSGSYYEGQTCTLTAIPNMGYSFVKWTKNGVAVSYNPTYAFVVNSDGDYEARFELIPGYCNIVFDLVDSYGDGWQGNELVVNYDSITEHLTVPSGQTASYTLTVATSSHITLSWISGSYISDCSFTLSYESGETIYSTSNINSNFSYEFDVDCGCSATTQFVSLSQGWNWVSTYIEAEDPIELLQMLETALGEDGLVIKSMDDYTTYEDGEWGVMGDLDDEGIVNEQMYAIQVSADCTVQLQGLLASPGAHAITIYPGWNWIGFPIGQVMSIEDALSDYEPEDGDVIKGMEDYSTYADGWGDTGDLEELTPGHGYKYYSNSTVPKILVFSADAKKVVILRGKRKE